MNYCQSAVQKMTALFGLCFRTDTLHSEKRDDEEEEEEEEDPLTRAKISRLKKRTQLVYALSQLEVSHLIQRVSCVTNSLGMCTLDKIKYSAACRNSVESQPCPRCVNPQYLNMYKSKLLGVTRNCDELSFIRDEYVQRNYSTLYALYLLFCYCFTIEGFGDELSYSIYDVYDLYEIVCTLGGSSRAMVAPVKSESYGGVGLQLAAKRKMNELELASKINKMKEAAKTSPCLDRDYYYFTLVSEQRLVTQDPVSLPSNSTTTNSLSFNLDFLKNLVAKKGGTKEGEEEEPEITATTTTTPTVPYVSISPIDEEVAGGSPRTQQQDDCAVRSRNSQFLKQHPTKECIDKMLSLPVSTLRLLFSGIYKLEDDMSTTPIIISPSSHHSGADKKCQSDLCGLSFWFDLLIPLMNRSYGKPGQNVAIINFLKKNRSFFSSDALLSFSVACRKLKYDLVPGSRNLFEYVIEQSNYDSTPSFGFYGLIPIVLNTFNSVRWSKCISTFYLVLNSKISNHCKSLFGSPGSDGDILVWDSPEEGGGGNQQQEIEESFIFSSPEERSKLPRSKLCRSSQLKRAYFDATIDNSNSIDRVTFSGTDTNQAGSAENNPNIMSSFRLKSKLLLTSIFYHICIMKANAVQLKDLSVRGSGGSVSSSSSTEVSFSNDDAVRPEKSCYNHPLEETCPAVKGLSDVDRRNWCFQQVDKFLLGYKNAKTWHKIFEAHSINGQSFNPVKTDHFTPNFSLLLFVGTKRCTVFSHEDVCCHKVIREKVPEVAPSELQYIVEEDVTNERIVGERIELSEKDSYW